MAFALPQRRRRYTAADFIREFGDGWRVGDTIAKSITDAETARQVAAIQGAGVQEASSSPAMIEIAPPDPAGMTYDVDTGQYVPSLAAIEAGPAEGAEPRRPILRPSMPVTTKYELLGKSFDQAPTEEEIAAEKARATAAAYRKAGREEDATRVLLNTARARELADQDAIRRAASPDRSNAHLGAAVGAGSDIGAGASIAPTPPTNPGGAAGVSIDMPAVGQPPGEGGLQPSAAVAAGRAQMSGPQRKGQAAGAWDLEHYSQTVAPKLVAEYLRQGRVTEAKALQDFVDGAEGKAYTRDWAAAVRQTMAGDFDGAIPALTRLYDRMPDGMRAKATHLGDGKYQVDFSDERTGEVQRSMTVPAGDLARKAVMALRPEKLVEFMAQQEGKRTTEAAALDKALAVEGLRQQGQEARDDRRDERLQMRLDAQAEAIAKRLEAGGLTASQRARNAEIDAARKATEGLAPDEIRRRTAKATSTGRENPDYDPTLAHNVGLAGRRKVGDDEWFDSRAGNGSPAGQSPTKAPTHNRDDIARRFRADRAMDGYTLGNTTDQGVEVLKGGKLVGHYR